MKANKKQKQVKKNKKKLAKGRPADQNIPKIKDDGLIADRSGNEDVELQQSSNNIEMSASDIINTEVPEKRKIKGRAEHRSEPSQTISEFNLTEVGKEKVKLDELIKTSQNAGQLSVKKQLQNAKKLKSLSIPLSKPQFQKIKRSLAYDNVCNEVAKWDKIVKSNRDAEQVIYPLKRPEFHLESFESASEKYISKHPVEEAVSKILQTSENVLDQTKSLTAAEEKALQAMSLEEAKLRHSELMKHRALISYKEAKARRQNRIKSKRYHRILKREKLKQLMKEFEDLQKTDQKAALEKFIEADKLRILERMTLKHRNTGKWAKQQKIRAKYNPESRSNLKEDLLVGKQLREKVSANVCQQSKLKDSEVDPEDKFFEDASEDFLIEDVPFENESVETAISNVTNFVKSQIHTERKKETRKETQESKASTKPVKITSIEDDMAFSSEVSCLNSLIPDDITFGDEDLDDKDDDKITINQAFADEDLIAEFQEEKKAADRANRPQGINLFLPGWGSWGGPSIKNSKRKRRRFFIKPLEEQTKKNTLGNVILNEEKDKKASEHQVSHLPFPFSNVKQFESYIRQPVGHTWNPQSSFQNLIAPKVITKMGKIIEPIDSEDVAFENKTKADVVKKRKKGTKEIKPF